MTGHDVNDELDGCDHTLEAPDSTDDPDLVAMFAEVPADQVEQLADFYRTLGGADA